MIKLAYKGKIRGRDVVFRGVVIDMSILSMATDEIRAMIPEDVLRRIKNDDPDPLFKAFVVGHLGTSYPKEVGKGSIIIKWIQSAIRSLVDVLKRGTKVFHGHNADSSHGERTSIGEVVGKVLKDIKGQMSAIAAVYIYPMFNHLTLDVASIEADVTVDPQSPDEFKAVGVNEITGIALGDSSNETPAFSGAKLIGQLQAFRNQSIQSSKGDDMDKMTIDEIRTVIKENSIPPSDLFDRETLTDDPIVKGFVKAEVKEAGMSEYHARKRSQTESVEKVTELETKLVEKDNEIIGYKKETAKTKLADLYKTEKDKRGFGTKQDAFIKSHLKKFEVSDPDKIAEEFSKFLDDEVDDFKAVSKVLGVKVKDGDGETKKGEEEETETDEETDENGDEDNGDGDEYHNPFLPSIDELK
jgi:hypothetical protein